MKARQLKEKYFDFFKAKGHQEIPNVSLIPENDSSTLFISAGMHPLVPYLMGQPHPLGKRLVGLQRCLRTSDINSVGDGRHHIFFEMLGNWSLNDYFKEEAISWSFEFLTQILRFNPRFIWVTVYQSDKETPKIWKKLGIPENHLVTLGKKTNWWEREGVAGPGGPDTEMFIDLQSNQPEVPFVIGEKSGRYLEIWNDVFMDHYTDGQGHYRDLGLKNVDTGMGVERILAALDGKNNDYLTSVWQPIIKTIEVLRKGENQSLNSVQIIADYLKAVVFLIADGIEPSNKEGGYVLRRLIRKSVRLAKSLAIESLTPIVQAVIDNRDNYADNYDELNNPDIVNVVQDEEKRFKRTLELGLKELKHYQTLTGKEAFKIYESYGFPLELIEEELGIVIDKDEFDQAGKEHQRKSKTLDRGAFKSGLQDNSEMTTKYHTATHLLQAGLRQLLGNQVHQAGSNITPERLRFDFTYPSKLTSAQISAVENLVNQMIQADLPVASENMTLTKAKKSGALAVFGDKYPAVVSVYTIGNFSREVCTGPHVKRTSVLGRFKIIKEESAGSSKRRLYAILK